MLGSLRLLVEEFILYQFDQKAAPMVFGISGAQGCGKSTLVAKLAKGLAEKDLKVAVVSIDAENRPVIEVLRDSSVLNSEM